ncbi:MAG: PAS domain-containing protein, partial [Thermoanaerobaculum sp.]
MSVFTFVAMALQLAAVVLAVVLVRKVGLSAVWVFFALAGLAMLGWRFARFLEYRLEPYPIPFTHALLDTIFGLAVTVFFFLALVFSAKLFAQLHQERQLLAHAQGLTEQEREKLGQLLERLPVGVVVEGEEGIVYVNAALTVLLGIEAHTLRHKSVRDVLAPGWWEKLEENGKRSSSAARGREVELVKGDGSRVWVAARVHRVVWMGAPAAVWVFSDITQQKAEEAEKEALLQLFTQGPVVLIRWRPAPARNVAFVSQNIRAWGFSPEMLMADPEPFYKWAHPEDRERVQKEAQEYFAAGASSWSQAYRLVCPDGRVRWVLDRTVVLRDAHGQVVGFDGYLLDVTEAEEARRQLEEERLRSAAAIEATGEVVYDWNVKTGAISWSRASFDRFGYAPEAMGGITTWEERIHPEDRDRVLLLLNRTLTTGEPFEAEYRYLRADGTYAHVLDRGAVERDAEGKPVRMVGAMVDITAPKTLEAQLRLAQRLESLGQLAGGVAHDFNNLLTAIMGTVDLMEKKISPGDPMMQDVKNVRKAAERAASLTQQLLAFSRRQIVELKPLDLNAHLQASLSMFRRLMPENVTVDFLPGSHLGTIMADPGQLDQILVNLLVNARDAMPEGGTITIETENVLVNGEYVRQHPWAKEGRYVLLSVSDTGVGMDEATRQRVFEPFFTTKEPGKGTGLGLSTVYGIVKQHDGMIHVYSEVGKGTTFKIYFPLVERRAVEVGTKVEGPVVGGNERIMLVEDEETVRQVLAESLGALGYEVLTAADGEEALQLLEERGFAVHLVVSD